MASATVFDCFRFMELAEIGRCCASGPPSQTHQGGLLSSIDMAVVVCCGDVPAVARAGVTPVVYRCVAVRQPETRERASERRTSERASGERAIERRASERSSGAQQTSSSVCGSQRASERAESGDVGDHYVAHIYMDERGRWWARSAIIARLPAHRSGRVQRVLLKEHPLLESARFVPPSHHWPRQRLYPAARLDTPSKPPGAIRATSSGRCNGDVVSVFL